MYRRGWGGRGENTEISLIHFPFCYQVVIILVGDSNVTQVQKEKCGGPLSPHSYSPSLS